MDFANSGDGGEPTTEDQARSIEQRKPRGDAKQGAHSGSLAAGSMAIMDISRISFLRKEAQRRQLGLDLADFIMTMAT